MPDFYKFFSIIALMAALLFIVYILAGCQSAEEKRRAWTSQNIYETFKRQGIM